MNYKQQTDEDQKAEDERNRLYVKMFFDNNGVDFDNQVALGQDIEHDKTKVEAAACYDCEGDNLKYFPIFVSTGRIGYSIYVPVSVCQDCGLTRFVYAGSGSASLRRLNQP